MKRYPSIEKKINHDIPVHGFDKLDGSNIRVEWEHGAGFTRFGSRHRLLDPEDEQLGRAPEIIRDKYQTALDDIFREHGLKNVTAFFEYFGEKSFVGVHEPGDDSMDAVLIDVMPARMGLLTPAEFLVWFANVPTPRLVYEGKVTPELVRSIQTGTLPGVTFEGVVFKGRGGKKGNLPIMFKVKSEAWLEKLRKHCARNAELFAQLA